MYARLFDLDLAAITLHRACTPPVPKLTVESEDYRDMPAGCYVVAVRSPWILHAVPVAWRSLLRVTRGPQPNWTC